MKSALLFLFVLFVGLTSGYFWMESRQERKVLTDEIRSQAPGHFITLKHGKVHYVLNGPAASELIVFIHGGGITGMEVWRRNLPYFRNKGYQVLAFDLYGRGYTDRPRIDQTPQVFIEQLTELLDTLGLNKQPLNIVSMSMGSIIALDYASIHPEMVKKMIIIDPAIAGDYKPNPLLRIPGVSKVLLTAYWYPRAVEKQRKEFADNALFDGYSKRLKYFMDFKGYKQSNYSTWMNMLNQNRMDKISAVPVSHLLLIYGEKDPYFKESQYLSFRSKSPACEALKIEWAGHMPHFEKPLEVNHAIHSFLRGVDGSMFSLYQ